MLFELVLNELNEFSDSILNQLPHYEKCTKEAFNRIVKLKESNIAKKEPEPKQIIENAEQGDVSKIIVIGSVGSGKSTFLNLLSGSDDTTHFKECYLPSSCTQFTEVRRYKWLGKGENIEFCDTQGNHDVGYGAQNAKYTKQMVQEIKKMKYVNMVIILMNGANIRFTSYTKETINLFINMFTKKILTNIVIVFSHWDITQMYEQETKIRNQYQQKFQDLFQCDDIPIYFMDSCFDRPKEITKFDYGGPRYNQSAKSEYYARLQNLYGTLMTTNQISLANIKAVDKERDIANEIQLFNIIRRL